MAEAPDPVALAAFREATGLHRQGRVPEALAAYEALLVPLAGHADLFNNRGIALTQLGRPAEAEASYARAIAIDPRHADTHVNLGIARGQQGDFDAAVAAFDAALALAPSHSAARGNRAAAIAARDARRAPVAVAAKARPDVDAAVMAGVARGQAGDPVAALAAFDAALAIDPGHAAAHANRALALRALGRAAEALDALDRALALGLADAMLHNARGEILADLGHPDAALASFHAALAAGGGDAGLHARMGRLLAAIGQHAAAVASFDAALALAPGHAALHQERSEALTLLDRPAEALAAIEAALAIDPTLPLAAGQRLHLATRLADWTDHAARLADVVAGVRAGRLAATPFALLALVDDPALHRAAATRFLQPLAAAPVTPGDFGWAPHDRLRIGYFSADYHDHATMYLFAEALAAHDPARVETFGFSYGKDRPDPMRAVARGAFSEFIDVRGDSDAAIVAMARAREIDIAIDLKGLTGGSRTGIFAARAAPIQANFLGYPGTMPAPWMDYMIADAIVVPPAERAHVAEALVTLPHSYQPNGRDETIGPRPDRAGLGLPDQGFVFCSFNQIHKITPAQFASWMRILAAVEGSVLWLWCEQVAARANLRAAAAAAGIAPDRLVFAATLPRAAHLARLTQAELVLDTAPYNAHTTASDALIAGVPVLTCPGRSFASRVAASLLSAVGLPEMIVADAAVYEAQAVALARDPARLAAMRAHLAAVRRTAPLFDPQAFARALEAGFAAMHARRLAGLPPADIVI